MAHLQSALRQSRSPAFMPDRENSLIIGLALVVGGFVMIGVVYILVIVVDAGNGLYSRLPSASMAPTLLSGDYVTSRRIEAASNPSSVHRGDVVVYELPPDPTKQFTKRVIGVPGDTLAMKEAVVLLNGRPLPEAYAQHSDSTDPVADEFRWERPYLIEKLRRDSARYVPSRDNWGPLVVPSGSFFVLGDNRTESLDSRYHGFVPANGIVARVRRVYFSLDSSGSIRWSRLGRLVR